MPRKTTRSIVIPVYNGALTIEPVVERLLGILGAERLQIVLVNDGSPDHSGVVCRHLMERHPGVVTYVELARNFGEHNAVMAGLHHARGDYVVVMDDDGQNPPEEVPRLFDHAEQNHFDVVFARYDRKNHHWLRNVGSLFNDRMANWLLRKPRGLYLASFKCMSRFIVGEVIRYQGPYPYVDGLILRSTDRIGSLRVRHDARTVGRSNYSVRKLVRLWLNMLINFSVAPLRLSALLGVGSSMLGVLLGITVVLERITNPAAPLGWASLLVCTLMFSGTQLLILGILGEYLGRLFLSSNQTPQFVVREVRVGTSPSCPTATSSTRSETEASSSPGDWDFSAATSPAVLSPSAPE